MTSAVCTLYEGHYHLGVAALLNSLYTQGFRGAAYIGYRGELPPWAATPTPTPDWPGGHVFEAADGLRLVFLPLTTSHHLTNHKPDFMLRLWANADGLARGADALFYFDPDIVIDVPWRLFEDWVGCGIAVCEDVNSPLPQHHPIRCAWRRYFGAQGLALSFKSECYANAGFVGVSRAQRSFLETWQTMQTLMAPAIGGLQNSGFNDEDSQPFDPFSKTDQDALNATIEAWSDGVVSLVGKVGMGFANSGQHLMAHALGSPKPWQWPTLRNAFIGRFPSLAERSYWRSANGVLVSQPAGVVRRQQLAQQLALAIGHFYGRR